MKINEIARRRSRRTGTVVVLIDNRDGSFDATDLPWFTLCEDHGGIASHPTRKLAAEWAPVPDEWCPGCQAEPDPCPECGTLLAYSHDEDCSRG